MEPNAMIQVSILLQLHRTVFANFVPGHFGLFRGNPRQPLAEARLKNTEVESPKQWNPYTHLSDHQWTFYLKTCSSAAPPGVCWPTRGLLTHPGFYMIFSKIKWGRSHVLDVYVLRIGFACSWYGHLLHSELICPSSANARRLKSRHPFAHAAQQPIRPVTSLGDQWWRRVFWEGPKIFKLYMSNSFQLCPTHFSREGIVQGGFSPTRSPGYGPATHQFIWQQQQKYGAPGGSPMECGVVGQHCETRYFHP